MDLSTPYGPNVRVIARIALRASVDLSVQVRDAHAVTGWRELTVINDKEPNAIERASNAAIEARRKLLEGEKA